MIKKKNICVISGSRAEYGLLFCTLKRLKKSDKFNLNLVLTGMHLSALHGNTYKQVEKDGFKIKAKLQTLQKNDDELSISKSLSVGILKTSEIFKKIKPDLLLILGDRYEIFAAASAAMIMNIPIAHIHGGELTKGLIDEAIRHSITKMSHIHFVTTNTYKNRVVQLGENPKKVFNVGAPGICLLYTSPSPRDGLLSRMPSSA